MSQSNCHRSRFGCGSDPDRLSRLGDQGSRIHRASVLLGLVYCFVGLMSLHVDLMSAHVCWLHALSVRGPRRGGYCGEDQGEKVRATAARMTITSRVRRQVRKVGGEAGCRLGEGCFLQPQ